MFVGVRVGVLLGVGVRVTVGVIVGVFDGVFVGVFVPVGVTVGVFVLVGVIVDVGVLELVGVIVGVLVGGLVGVFVGVLVAVGVENGVAARLSTQPLDSVRLSPKELAGTIPGHAASTLRKSNNSVSEELGVIVYMVPAVQLLGEEVVSTVVMRLAVLLKEDWWKVWLGLAPS